MTRTALAAAEPPGRPVLGFRTGGDHMRNRSARAITGASLAAAALALTGCSSGSYSATVVSYQPLDPAHLGVTIQVTNNGSSAGTPECQIEASSSDDSDTGFDDVTLEGTLAAGASTKFNDSIVITNQGAAAVSDVTVSCHG